MYKGGISSQRTAVLSQQSWLRQSADYLMIKKTNRISYDEKHPKKEYISMSQYVKDRFSE